MAKLRAYEGEAIRVLFDAKRCIHAAECVHGQPAVFNAENKPWILPDQGDADDIAKVVSACPTGALSFERKDGGPAEERASENTAAIVADGPIFLRGDIQVVDKDQNVVAEGGRLALCRCGASKIKPFCDNSHVEAEFKAASTIPDPKIRQTDGDGTTLKVILADNGPLIFDGPVTVLDHHGEDTCSGNKTALCRCGASANKPFCDGAHSKIGFEA